MRAVLQVLISSDTKAISVFHWPQNLNFFTLLSCCLVIREITPLHIAVTQLHINLFIKDKSKFKKLKIIFLSILSNALSSLSDLVVYLTFRKSICQKRFEYKVVEW